MTIICEKGMLLFDDMEPIDKLKLYDNYLTSGNSIPIANKTVGNVVPLDLSESPLLRECNYFVECCRMRKKPLTDGEEAIRVLKVLNMCSVCLMKQSFISDLAQAEKLKSISVEPKLDYYVHDSSIVDNGAKISTGSKIWHWTHITSSAEIGRECNIGQGCYIAGILGNGCKVQNNVSVYLGVECGDNVFLGPSCVLTNDLNPRCGHPKHGEYVKTYIEEGATIGANATIRCGIRIGKHSLIGAGATVVRDVDEYAIMVGNPAKRIGTIDELGNRTLF
jgi:UDP-2-acetamido-3-amino-2,3-dideoxy-glucuronate N-acetyltransferase